MRSYGQYCALAKALDVIGDRWTLLIVRELLLRGACRYTDLRDGLPGIATNLLADRLRALERAGVVRREDAPPPVATTLVRLTPRGEDLEPILQQLGRWGGPLLAQPARKDVFRTHWLALPARHCLRDQKPKRAPVTIEVRTDAGGEPLTIQAVGGALRMRTGAAEKPDAVLSGTPPLVVGLLTGKLSIADARAAGLRYDGSPAALRRLQPRA